MAGIRRSRVVPVAKKQAAVSDVMLIVLSGIDESGARLADLRNRALLSFGMASAMRHSELVALDVANLQFGHGGVRVTIRRSKTDQDGAGAVIAVPDGRRLRLVAALRVWLDQASITSGAVFRQVSRSGKRLLPGRLSDREVARVVQTRFGAAKYDPALFTSHSLRSGFLTSAADTGASIWKMREVRRHKTVQVLADYVQSAGLLDRHAGRGFLRPGGDLPGRLLDGGTTRAVRAHGQPHRSLRVPTRPPPCPWRGQSGATAPVRPDAGPKPLFQATGCPSWRAEPQLQYCAPAGPQTSSGWSAGRGG